MTTVAVGRLSPQEQWDQTMLDDLFSNNLYPTGLDFVRYDGYPDADGCILVIPGRYYHHQMEQVNAALARYRWVLAIRAGDEEDLFDVSRIHHPNIRWWVQTPRVDQSYGQARLFGVGYTPHFRSLPAKWPVEPAGIFLAAQNTHPRRHAAFNALLSLRTDMVALPTEGFSQGMPPAQYAAEMMTTALALAPSGPQTADTFRVYEALEAHTVPVADDITPNHGGGYWQMVCPDAPFPVVRSWAELSKVANDVMASPTRYANSSTAWWMRYKWQMSRWLIDDLQQLGGIEHQDGITVVVPTSPIRSHPDVDILNQTIGSIRHHLPHSLILLTFDGVREEQEELRENYEEYTRRALWLADHDPSWRPVVPYVFDHHVHQVGMMRHILPDIHTSLLMYVEHDMPLRTDRDINLGGVVDFVTSGRSDAVRYYLRDEIPPEHDYLMHGMEPGLPFLRTRQWSQNVHVATTALYRRALREFFSADACSFIEDGLHGVIVDGYPMDWCRLHIYRPDGDIRCLVHLDGRGTASKFEREQRF